MPSLGKPFSAAKVKGKLIYIIEEEGTPYNNLLASSAENAGEVAGSRVKVIVGDGSPASEAAGIQEAITNNAAAIVLQGMDDAPLAPQIKQALAAHIVVTSVDTYVEGQTTPVTGLVNVLNGPYVQIGELEAAAAVATFGDSTYPLLLTTNDNSAAKVATDSFASELKSLCPSCKLAQRNESVVNWPNFAGDVSSTLVSTPGINVIVPPFDSEMPYVNSGLAQAGATDKVKIVSANGTPAILAQMTQGGNMVANVGLSGSWVGVAGMAGTLRLLAGGPTTTYGSVFRVFTPDNLSAAGSPPNNTTGYGSNSALLAAFKALLQ